MARCNRLLLLLCCSLPAVGHTSVQMELSAGLGGQAVSGLPTELGVRLFASTSTEAELQFSDANGATSIAVTIDGQTEKRLWIPVNPEVGVPLQVRLLSATGEVIEKGLAFEHTNTPLTLISGPVPAYQDHFQNQPGHQQATRIRPVVIAPGNLPRGFHGYAGVAAIVTHVDSLSGLSTGQYRAFAKYLGGCNVLLLASAEPEVLQRIRNLSGCGGRFIRSYPALAEVPALLQELDSQRVVKSPSAEEMLSLQSPLYRSEMLTSLSLYLAGYIVFMALLAWRLEKTRYLLILPIVVAGAGILTWSGNGSARLITWTEMQSGDSHLRVSSLLLLGGNRRGKTRISVDADAALSSFSNATQHHRNRNLIDDSRWELSAHTDLLTPAIYQLSSVDRQFAAFSLLRKDGQPELIYHAETPHDQARLMWQGHIYEVPALSRGQTWQPRSTQNQRPLTPEEKLLQRRLEFDSAALLLPFPSASQEVATGYIQDQGWLVIRQQPEQGQ